MRKLIIGVAAVLAVLIVAAILVPRFIPAEFYRARIVDAAQAATGRQVRIDGPVKFTILPGIAIEAADIAVANAPGGIAKDMAVIGKLQVGLRLLPLIAGNVEIDRFVLVDPAIHLEIDKSGKPNWVFQPGNAPPPATPAAQQQAAQQTADLRQLRLGEVKIVNGLIDYADARTGDRQEFSQIGVTVKLPSLDDPSSIEGDLTWRGKAIKLTVHADRPRALEGDGAGAIKVKLSSDPLTFSLDGTVTGGAPMKFAGDSQLDIPSVRDLAAWTGNAVAAGGTGFGPLSFKGKLDAAGPRIAMTEMALAFDAIKAKGSLSVDTSGERPAIKGDLAIDALDLNPYLARPGKAASPPGPAAPALAAQEGWSDAPIDFSSLKMADVSITAGADSIRYEKIEIGKSALAVDLQNGHLTADLTQLALYGGEGKGRIALDSTQAAPTVDASFTLTGIQAGPLLTAAIDFDRMTGTGALDFALSTHGRSQRELVGALSGKGNFAFTKGTIKGINLPAMVRNAATSFIDSGSGGSDQTDFSELSGSFTVADGIAKNSDLTLKSSAMQATGAGTIDMPRRNLSYRIEPKLVLAGNGGDAAGLTVPVIIDGPWSKLNYRPDLQGLVTQNTGKLLQGIEGTVIPGGKAGGVLKGIFGGK